MFVRAGGLEHRGKVIAGFSFGFWKYLCARHYLTSLWVDALAGAFPQHPSGPDPRSVRSDVHNRMTRVHKLRNRVAHHEPIHNRVAVITAFIVSPGSSPTGSCTTRLIVSPTVGASVANVLAAQVGWLSCSPAAGTRTGSTKKVVWAVRAYSFLASLAAILVVL